LVPRWLIAKPLFCSFNEIFVDLCIMGIGGIKIGEDMCGVSTLRVIRRSCGKNIV